MTGVAVLVVDRLGRRPLLLTGVSGMVSPLFYQCFSFYRWLHVYLWCISEAAFNWFRRNHENITVFILISPLKDKELGVKSMWIQDWNPIIFKPPVLWGIYSLLHVTGHLFIPLGVILPLLWWYTSRSCNCTAGICWVLSGNYICPFIIWTYVSGSGGLYIL